MTKLTRSHVLRNQKRRERRSLALCSKPTFCHLPLILSNAFHQLVLSFGMIQLFFFFFVSAFCIVVKYRLYCFCIQISKYFSTTFKRLSITHWFTLAFYKKIKHKFVFIPRLCDFPLIYKCNVTPTPQCPDFCHLEIRQQNSSILSFFYTIFILGFLYFTLLSDKLIDFCKKKKTFWLGLSWC